MNLQKAIDRLQHKMSDAASIENEAFEILGETLEFMFNNVRPGTDNKVENALNRWYRLMQASAVRKEQANIVIANLLKGIYDVEFDIDKGDRPFTLHEMRLANIDRRRDMLVSKAALIKDEKVSQQLLYHHEKSGKIIPYDKDGNRMPIKKRQGKYYRYEEVQQYLK